jgi:hypothetical protein
VKNDTGYVPQQGTMAKINKSMSIAPTAVAPGDKAQLNGSYSVMFPPDKKEISVTETLILKAYNQEKKDYQEVGRSSDTVVAAPGERQASSEIPIPDDKQAVGKYRIAFMIATADGKTDTKEMPLTVTQDKAVLAKARREGPQPAAEPVAVAAAQELNGSKSIADNTKYVQITVPQVVFRDRPSLKGKRIGTAAKDGSFVLVDTKTVGAKKWYCIMVDEARRGWMQGSSGKIVEK